MKEPSARLPALELLDLCKNFGGLEVTRSVNLTVMPGERHAIIGPNGAGKTTLFNLISGVLEPSSGQIMMFGETVTRWPSHRRAGAGMSRTFQVTSLFPRLSVLENLLLAIQGVHRSKYVMWRTLDAYRGYRQRALELLERSDFSNRAEMKVQHLSHGEQRQLEIIVGLASNPRILLLDEPAAGLSTGESREMTRLLQGLADDLAVVLVEHDMDVVFNVATSISVLHLGQLIESGPPEKIRNSQLVQEIYLGVS